MTQAVFLISLALGPAAIILLGAGADYLSRELQVKLAERQRKARRAAFRAKLARRYGRRAS